MSERVQDRAGEGAPGTRWCWVVGLAGAAVATLLARGGARVTLIEQYAEPRHKMCGEFLSTEACESLGMLGLDVRALGAVPVGHVRLVGGGGRCVEHDLPFEAWSLTRRVLDEAMLQTARASGVRVHRGERVESLEDERSGVAGAPGLRGDAVCAGCVRCKWKA